MGALSALGGDADVAAALCLAAVLGDPGVEAATKEVPPDASPGARRLVATVSRRIRGGLLLSAVG